MPRSSTRHWPRCAPAAADRGCRVRRADPAGPRANGKICDVEIPASDVDRSADVYAQVFGWQIRRRRDGPIAFDDTAEEVSGTWVTGRPPSPEPGPLFYVMVDSVADTIETVTAHGGQIVQSIDADAPEITAWFRDPAGNVVGPIPGARQRTVSRPW